MTAETESSDTDELVGSENASSMARPFLTVAALLLVVGLAISALASFQLVLPQLLSPSAYTTVGRLAPAARTLLTTGWLPVAGLWMAFSIISSITGSSIQRKPFGTAGLAFITIGSLSGAAAIIAGFSSGIAGLEAPVWTRAISAVGFLLVAFSIGASARRAADHLGAAGWYLTASAWWLAAAGVFGLAPLPSGVAGSIQAAFVSSVHNRLFVLTMAVGLLYFALSKITGTDPTAPRPLAALGFWSLGLTWAFMGGAGLIYSSVPDWYETLTIAFAIAALVPVLAILMDLGLMLKGRVLAIVDKATVAYAVTGGAALIGATLVNLLLVWRATNVVVGYSTWITGLDVLVILGGGSFAIFAANSARLGGRTRGTRFHTSLSIVGLVGTSAALLAGGIVTGFSWIAGPASEAFDNFGPAYKISTVAIAPFLWAGAISLTAYVVGQIIYLVNIDRRSELVHSAPDVVFDYNLEFEGSTRDVTWKRLAWGAAVVWISALLFSGALPIIDAQKADASIAADTFRSYPDDSTEAIGRDIYISQGCAECHTQSVRPIVTDVGLGPVSVSGDYAHENPALITGVRLGPDLMHVASREGFDPAVAAAHLVDPRSVRSWSTMPSYRYLSTADIDALVAYIETLR